MNGSYSRIVLASRPRGQVVPDNFRLETVPVPELKDGEVLVRNRFLSLDPYMRGRMSAAKSYAASQPLDETMIGATAGEVVASRHPRFAPGDSVTGMLGWAEMGVANGSHLLKVDASKVPLSAYLGVVGMPGVTAWYGLVKLIAPKAGDTVLVSAASGAVGSAVGQLARVRGCRAVGLAGGPEKCAYVERELGFDACIDYRAHADARALAAALKTACPDGIDGVFENVGGVGLDAAMLRINDFGRIAVCGLIAGYDGAPIPMAFPQIILLSRLTVTGFIVSEHLDVWPEALGELGALVAAGRLKYRESVAHGLRSAPEAFLGLLKGRNFGKQLVKLV